MIAAEVVFHGGARGRRGRGLDRAVYAPSSQICSKVGHVTGPFTDAE